jgi:hypothetical protein
MTGTRSHHRRAPLAAILAVLAIILTASMVSADPPGNNGTVKVHSSGGNETAMNMSNDPHVTCPFHFHFYFGDNGQGGTWWVADANGVGVAGGTYTADASGEAQSGDVSVPAAGHYMVSWTGRNEQNVKHKTFWVDGECGGGGGGG